MTPADSDSAQYDPEISLFLLLCRAHQDLVEGIAAACRKIVPSDPFIPHMTMYFGSGAPSGGIRSLVELVASSTKPVTQRISGVTGEPRFWRASYIALHGGAQVEAINATLKESIVNYGHYSYLPHVSLVYSNDITPIQQAEVKLLAEERLRDAGVSELLFDRVGMFQRHSAESAWEDVSRWREVCSASLRGCV
jgi:2'-5' RNA ligase